MRYLVRHRNGRALYWLPAASLEEACLRVATADAARTVMFDTRGQMIEPIDESAFWAMPRTFRASRLKEPVPTTS